MTYPKWFNEKESIKKTANKKEDKLYKHLLSGALSFKGDFSDKSSCLDLKATKHQSIRVTTNMLNKLVKDSLEMGKENSVLVLDLPEYYLVCKVTKKSEVE